MIDWIPPESDAERFPPTSDALTEPDGLLAAGGDLSPARLLAAYRRGIFPWYEEGQPILWWTPDPRCVLLTGQVHCSKRLQREIRQTRPSIRLDEDFAAVVSACAAPRGDGAGTWITQEMMQAYMQLHHMGHAHCVGVWIEEELVGGIYGVSLGSMFFGESMFHRRTNASKIALVALCHWLSANQCEALDCQVETAHIMRQGAELWPREEFEAHLAHATTGDALDFNWQGKAGTVEWPPYFKR